MARLSRLAGEVEEADRLSHRIHDLGDLLDLTESENDDSLLVDVTAEAGQISREVERLDLRVLLSGDYAENDAILSIHAGAGGTESQDWAQMLMRMYIRWAETHKYKVDIVQISEGEEAGIRARIWRSPVPTPTGTCVLSGAFTAWSASRPTTAPTAATPASRSWRSCPSPRRTKS